MLLFSSAVLWQVTENFVTNIRSTEEQKTNINADIVLTNTTKQTIKQKLRDKVKHG